MGLFPKEDRHPGLMMGHIALINPKSLTGELHYVSITLIIQNETSKFSEFLVWGIVDRVHNANDRLLKFSRVTSSGDPISAIFKYSDYI